MNEKVVLVVGWSKEKFAKWLSRGYMEVYGSNRNFKTFYPIHAFTGLSGDLTREILQIFDELPEDTQERFRNGMVIALEKLSGEALYHFLFLVGELKPQNVTLALWECMGRNNTLKGIDAVCFALLASRTTFDPLAVSKLKEMASSESFNFLLVPKMICALTRGEPDNLLDHLALAREPMRKLFENNPDEKQYAYLTAKRIVNVVGIERLTGMLTVLVDEGDRWFIEALFDGENAPLERVHNGIRKRDKKET